MRTYERVWGKPEDDVSLLGRDYGFEDHSDESDYNSIKDVEADLTEDDEIVIFNPLVAGVFDNEIKKVTMLIVHEDAFFDSNRFYEDEVLPYEERKRITCKSN